MWKWLFGDSYSISREEFLAYKAEQQEKHVHFWGTLKEQQRIISVQTNSIVNLSQRIQELEKVMKSHEKPH